MRVGDRLLQSVSQRLLQCVRSPDTVSRQGRDELVILIAGAKKAKAAVVTAEKILHAMRAATWLDAVFGQGATTAASANTY